MERFTKIPVQVQAGVHDVVVAFIDRSHVESDENVAAGFRGIGVLGFGDGQRPHGAPGRRRRNRRTVQSHGHFENCQPRPDFRLRSQENRRARLRASRLRKTWRAARSAGR